MRKTAHPIDEFGIRLFNKLGREPGNLFFSPYSIWACLALARVGAKGDTASELDALFGYPSDLETVQAGLAEKLLQDFDDDDSDTDSEQDSVGDSPAPVDSAHPNPMPALDGLPAPGVPVWADAIRPPACVLKIANSVWGQQGFGFEQSYLDTLESCFRAPMHFIDFAQSDLARAQINDWVAEITRDRIQDIVPPGMPYLSSRLALVNAIYFKASWQSDFDESATKGAVFHSPSGDVEVEMMRQVTHFGYAEDDAVQVCELEYQGCDASMVLILPKAPRDLDDVDLSKGRLAGLLGSLSSAKVDLQLPRYTFTVPLDLSSLLPELGVASAFNVQLADFTGMADVPGEPLFIGAVLHKAFIAVDEKGTEAAAATAGLMELGCAAEPPPVEPIPFVADRPFLFLIRHKGAECALFFGRVVDPTKS